jgi:hypothetical protein
LLRHKCSRKPRTSICAGWCRWKLGSWV